MRHKQPADRARYGQKEGTDGGSAHIMKLNKPPALKEERLRLRAGLIRCGRHFGRGWNVSASAALQIDLFFLNQNTECVCDRTLADILRSKLLNDLGNCHSL